VHEIQVSVISAEEQFNGIAELWAGDELIAFTHYEDGDLMLRIEPRPAGVGVVVGAQALVSAIAEANRRLSMY
jgi:hypothetical protein